MVRQRHEYIAYIPRGLRFEDAARYIGISVVTFVHMVANGRMPQPKIIDDCLVWTVAKDPLHSLVIAVHD
jgi:hypothetical protein